MSRAISTNSSLFADIKKIPGKRKIELSKEEVFNDCLLYIAESTLSPLALLSEILCLREAYKNFSEIGKNESKYSFFHRAISRGTSKLIAACFIKFNAKVSFEKDKFNYKKFYEWLEHLPLSNSNGAPIKVNVNKDYIKNIKLNNGTIVFGSSNYPVNFMLDILSKKNEIKYEIGSYQITKYFTPNQILLAILHRLYLKNETNSPVSNSIEFLEKRYISGNFTIENLNSVVKKHSFLSQDKQLDHMLSNISHSHIDVNNDSSRRFSETKISFELMDQLLNKKEKHLKIIYFHKALSRYFSQDEKKSIIAREKENHPELYSYFSQFLTSETMDLYNSLIETTILSTEFEHASYYLDEPILNIYNSHFEYLPSGRSLVHRKEATSSR